MSRTVDTTALPTADGDTFLSQIAMSTDIDTKEWLDGHIPKYRLRDLSEDNEDMARWEKGSGPKRTTLVTMACLALPVARLTSTVTTWTQTRQGTAVDQPPGQSFQKEQSPGHSVVLRIRCSSPASNAR